MRDTIFALSSGNPPAGVAIVRISGPGVRFGLETLVGQIPPARMATFCDIKDKNQLRLDRGLALFFRHRIPSPVKMSRSCTFMAAGHRLRQC